MSMLVAEPVFDHICLLGEGPVWNDLIGVISWVDILRGEIHEFSEASHEHRTLHLGQMIGSFVITADGDYMAALRNGLGLVDRNSGQITHLHHPEAHLPGNRFNEGKCDPAGRFWVGSMAMSEEPGAGNLYMIDRDLSFSLKVPAVSISNGLAWSLDERTLYYIDSPTRQVVAYTYDKQTGEIKDKRVVIRMNEEDGFPDGMTIDTEGMLWIGHWDGWQVGRWNPVTGEKILSIRMPVAKVTSCTFGGSNLQDLYITTASTGMSNEELRGQPTAGSLFVVKNSGYCGLEPIHFKY